MMSSSEHPSEWVCVFITREAWEGVLRTLLVEPGGFAWGTVRWRRESQVEEVLCDRLETTREPPRGADRPPFDDWLVLVVDHGETISAVSWIDRIGPKRSQRLVVIVLDGRERSCWDAVLYDRGQCVPIEALAIAGSGMLAMQRTPRGTGTASEESQLRASRTAGALGLELFGKVCAACVSLIAKETLTVHLDIGTHVAGVEQGGLIHGDVRLLTPDRDGGCVACVGRLRDVEETLYELGAPTGVLRRGEPLDWRQQRAGSLLTINSIAVGIGVQMWLDFLAGRLRTSYWHRLRWVPGGAMQVDGGPVGKADDCRFCRPA